MEEPDMPIPTIRIAALASSARFALAVIVVGPVALQSQETQQPIPPSTNPTNLVLYPSEGQDEQQIGRAHV